MPSREDYSTPRVHRFRGHQNGDHSECRWHGCEDRRNLESDNQWTMEAKACFRKLAERGIDPKKFFGDHYDAAIAVASKEFPDYDYLDKQPNRVAYLAADPRIFLMGLRDGFQEPEPPDDFDYDALFEDS